MRQRNPRRSNPVYSMKVGQFYIGNYGRDTRGFAYVIGHYKNGSAKAIVVIEEDGHRYRRAAQMAINKYDMQRYDAITESAVPAKARKKLAARDVPFTTRAHLNPRRNPADTVRQVGPEKRLYVGTKHVATLAHGRLDRLRSGGMKGREMVGTNWSDYAPLMARFKAARPASTYTIANGDLVTILATGKSGLVTAIRPGHAARGDGPFYMVKGKGYEAHELYRQPRESEWRAAASQRNNGSVRRMDIDGETRSFPRGTKTYVPVFNADETDFTLRMVPVEETSEDEIIYTSKSEARREADAWMRQGEPHAAYWNPRSGEVSALVFKVREPGQRGESQVLVAPRFSRIDAVHAIARAYKVSTSAIRYSHREAVPASFVDVK